MPRVDGIGVSSAGVFVGNSPMVSALFLKVPRSERAFVKDIYNAAAARRRQPAIAVVNDGDVTALAGAMELRTGRVMGLAMGTSEAVGYVDAAGNILGWFNELAFAPVDLNERAMADEWSGDAGVGCKYLSQDAVIKLAPAAGITLSERLTPAEKLSEVQRMLEAGWDAAAAIFSLHRRLSGARACAPTIDFTKSAICCCSGAWSPARAGGSSSPPAAKRSRAIIPSYPKRSASSGRTRPRGAWASPSRRRACRAAEKNRVKTNRTNFDMRA
jgi:hypothetical protein